MRRESAGAHLLLAPAVILMVLLFILPIALFFIRSLGEGDGLEAVFTSVILSEALQHALAQTFLISGVVTLIVLLFGYPIAYYLTTAKRAAFSITLLCIIVPYFTSVIVRTYSWMVILGRNGLINKALMALGLTSQPVPLLYNLTGVLIGMSYVMLPYMVLTLYAALRRIDPALMRAAQGLGATDIYAFRKVYFPLSLHGVVSGALIVLILCLGFFVTPALMGGPSDVMIAMLIQKEVELSLNWQKAAMMSLVLLVVTFVFYIFYYRLTDFERLMGK